MGTPILGELLKIGTDIITQLGVYIKDTVNFVVSNFRYDNANHLFVLSIILLLISVALIGLFGAVGIGGSIVDPGRIPIGSGNVMTGAEDYVGGDLFLEGPGGAEEGGDTDGDGIIDNEDEDIDGDGILNNQDYDIDGDNYPNDADLTPCGVYVEVCENYPVLCPNNVCDSFQTPAKRVELESVYSFCSDRFLFHDISSYCLRGIPLDTVTFAQFPGLVYHNAVCGTVYARNRMNSRCVINSDGTIWYVETAVTCPLDCNMSYDCFIDLSCDTNPYNCALFDLVCCPAGTFWAGYCTDCIYWACNNNPSGDCITRAGYSLAELKRVPCACPCVSHADCVGDFEGEFCCGPGTYHEGFCYQSSECDIV